MKMNETLKELFENIADEMANQLGQPPSRIILDFDKGKISGVITTKIGKTFHNRIIEFEGIEGSGRNEDGEGDT